MPPTLDKLIPAHGAMHRMLTSPRQAQAADTMDAALKLIEDLRQENARLRSENQEHAQERMAALERCRTMRGMIERTAETLRNPEGHKLRDLMNELHAFLGS